MLLFRNSSTVSFFLCRVRTAQPSRTVLPTGIFLCQIKKIWHLLEVVDINIFGLAYLLNLPYFGIFFNKQLFDIRKMF